MAAFKDRIKELRLESKLTMKELGEKLGLSESTISFYESGRREPKKSDDFIKIADYFNVSVDYLLGRVEQRTYKVYKDNIDGHEIEYSLDKDKYPDGLTHDQVIEVLEQLKKMGMDFSKFKKE